MTGSLEPLDPPDPDAPLAYHDRRFLDSDAARPLRILAEYLQPFETFRREGVQDTIVFFGSARLGPEGPLARYYHEARELARFVTEWSQCDGNSGSCFVVCSGGGGGIMEAANRGALEAGGRTIGLNIGLPHEQRPNPYVTRRLLFEFHYFFMRKLWFAYLARAMVVFPGGFGTMDELFEMLTLSQTGKLSRPVHVLLYGPQYWREIVDFPALVRHGMIAPQDLERIHFVDSPEEAMKALRGRLAPEGDRREPALAKSITCADPTATPRRRLDRDTPGDGEAAG